jgi:hypothetical protein
MLCTKPDGISAAIGAAQDRWLGSFHEIHSDQGGIILAVYRKPNVFQHSTGYARSKIIGSAKYQG